MQKIMSDMSLPDRVEVLERGLERERNKRHILKELVLELIQAKGMKFTEKGKAALLELDA